MFSNKVHHCDISCYQKICGLIVRYVVKCEELPSHCAKDGFKPTDVNTCFQTQTSAALLY